MSHPPKQSATLRNRERMKIEFTRAAPLREIYPQLANVRVEIEFDDGTPRKPSPQAFSYFPGARGFFRYACPCHTCSGEFDLSEHVAELVAGPGRTQRSSNVRIICPGQRTLEAGAESNCPILAEVRVSAVLHTREQST